MDAGRDLAELARQDRSRVSKLLVAKNLARDGFALDPRHDEAGAKFVLDGNGAVHVDGETAHLRAGSCIHLPARLVHCIENTGPGELRVLGVFRPAGSPAEAYYPDGTLARY